MGSALLQALVPLFFVLALGFLAGRRHAFDADQATGFNTLLVDFALPAMLFSSTVTIRRGQLLGDAPAVAVLTVAYVGVFFAVFAIHRWMLTRDSGQAALAGLLVASPAAPFFGPSVVTPIYGAQSGLTIASAALVINVLQVPLAIALIDPSSTSKAGEGGLLKAVASSSRQPVVLAPALALVLVLIGVRLPAFVETAALLIGSATSGVAVFASGLTLATHKAVITREGVLQVVGKLVVLPSIVLGLAFLFGVTGEQRSETVLISALSSGLIVLILASRYKIYVEQTASTVLLSALGMALALPVWILLQSKF